MVAVGHRAKYGCLEEMEEEGWDLLVEDLLPSGLSSGKLLVHEGEHLHRHARTVAQSGKATEEPLFFHMIPYLQRK